MSDNVSDVKHLISLNSSSRRSFAFSRPAFDGRKFYEKYGNALFLQNEENIRSILSKTDELQEQYDEMKPNEEMVIEEMLVTTDVPLVLKKSATVDESDDNQDDFTLRRLSGLAAVAALQKNIWNIYAVHSGRYIFQKPIRRIEKGRFVYSKLKEYLAAVNGTEYFVDCFDYLPFLVALKQINLKHINASVLIHIANMRHPDTQEPFAARCYSNFEAADEMAREYYGFDLKKVLQTAPKEVKMHCEIDAKLENAASKINNK